MDELLLRGIKVKISWINHPSIPREWLNRVIDRDFLIKMKILSKENNFDLAGEDGEYHTMALICF